MKVFFTKLVAIFSIVLFSSLAECSMHHKIMQGYRAAAKLKQAMDNDAPPAIIALKNTDPEALKKALDSGYDPESMFAGHSLLKLAEETANQLSAQSDMQAGKQKRATKIQTVNARANQSLISIYIDRKREKLAAQNQENSAAKNAALKAPQKAQRGINNGLFASQYRCTLAAGICDHLLAHDTSNIDGNSNSVANFDAMNAYNTFARFVRASKASGQSYEQMLNTINKIDYHTIFLESCMKLGKLSNARSNDDDNNYFKRLFQKTKASLSGLQELQEKIIQKILLLNPIRPKKEDKLWFDRSAQTIKSRFERASKIMGDDYKKTYEQLVQTKTERNAATEQLAQREKQIGAQELSELLDELQKLHKVDAKDMYGSPLLLYAALYADNTSLVDLLSLFKKYDADFNVRDEQGRIPLIVTFNPEVKKILMHNGACINHQDDAGETALHTACRAGAIDVVKVLLKEGINIGLTNKAGQTAYDVTTSAEMKSFLDKTAVGNFEKERQERRQKAVKQEKDVELKRLKAIEEEAAKKAANSAEEKAKRLRIKKAAKKQKKATQPVVKEGEWEQEQQRLAKAREATQRSKEKQEQEKQKKEKIAQRVALINRIVARNNTRNLKIAFDAIRSFNFNKKNKESIVGAYMCDGLIKAEALRNAVNLAQKMRQSAQVNPALEESEGYFETLQNLYDACVRFVGYFCIEQGMSADQFITLIKNDLPQKQKNKKRTKVYAAELLDKAYEILKSVKLVSGGFCLSIKRLYDAAAQSYHQERQSGPKKATHRLRDAIRARNQKEIARQIVKGADINNDDVFDSVQVHGCFNTRVVQSAAEKATQLL